MKLALLAAWNHVGLWRKQKGRIERGCRLRRKPTIREKIVASGPRTLSALFCSGVGRVEKISIVPRGMAALGYTSNFTEDQAL